MRVFISYARNDEKHAKKLEKDLREQNIGIWIDRKHIEPGDLWLKEIDEALYQVDYVLGIITEDYLKSTGVVEAYARISKDLKDKNLGFISLFFIPPSRVKSVILTAFQGIDFSESYENGLLELIKSLKRVDKEDTRKLLTQIENMESSNPFRRVRAEFFHEDYKLIALAFAEPEKEKYDILREDKPVIIFGGRGSGKTMILKSLIPEVIISRLDVEKFQEAKEKGIRFFGIYSRLKRGSLLIYDGHAIVEMGFLKTGLNRDHSTYKALMEKLENYQVDKEPVLTAGINAAAAISLNEMNLKVLRTTMQNLKKLQEEGFLTIDRATEEQIINEITEKLDPSRMNYTNTFNDLICLINNELKKIEVYLQNLAIPFADPNPTWCRTGTDFLDEVYEILANHISDLRDIRIYLLFDEFENLRPFQQIIINEWIKTAQNFTVKVSSKFGGMYTNMTLQGQPLQDGQDYFTWSLDYYLFSRKEKKLYQELLLKMCHNILDIEGYRVKDIRKLLEKPKELEFPQEIIDKEIKNVREKAGLEFQPEKLSKYRNKLNMAIIFRLLRKKEKVEGRKSKKKIYAGFETYTYLSSGIIRVFLNLVGMAFYKAEDENINVKEGEKISIENQTWAAFVVSKAWLEKIPINLEEYGELMYQFIVDIGDIFRERLLYRPHEPETLTVRISDSYNIRPNSPLDYILSYSTRESILYERKEKSSVKPKKSIKTQGKEYVLNRIYSPILEISHRPRWPRSSEFTTSELTDLLNPNRRDKTKKKLQKIQHGDKDVDKEKTHSLLKFLEVKDEKGTT